MKYRIEKYVLAALFTIVTTVPVMAQEPIVIQPNDTIVFAGDTGQFAGSVASYLAACQPNRYNVFSPVAGKIQELAEPPAGQSPPPVTPGDLMQFCAPQVVVLVYGTRAAEMQKSNPDLLDRYRQGLVAAVQRFKKGGAREVILCSPTAVDPDIYNSFNLPTKYDDFIACLADLDKVTKQVAADQKAGYIDLITPMTDTMKKAKTAFGNSYRMTYPDIVYPDSHAGPILTYAVLKAFNCDGNIGEIDFDMAAGTATGSDGQKIVSADKTKIAIDSTRYPFCFYNPGDPKDPNANISSLASTPFSQELNRYILKVKNPPDGKSKVTWGQASKDFTADQLKAGINLADEFPSNPFSPVIEKVGNDAQDRNVYVGWMAGTFMPETRSLAAAHPETKEASDNLWAAIMAQWGLIKPLKALPVVHHEITITPAS